MPDPFQSPSTGFGWISTVTPYFSIEQVAGQPGVVSCAFGPLAEELVFPLPEHDLGVDAGNLKTGFKTEVEVLLDDVTSVHVSGSHCAVVGPLGAGVSVGGESEGLPPFAQDVFLLKSKPHVLIVVPSPTCVRGMDTAIGSENFAHYEKGIKAVGVRYNADWFEQAVGGMSLSLLG